MKCKEWNEYKDKSYTITGYIWTGEDNIYKYSDDKSIVIEVGKIFDIKGSISILSHIYHENIFNKKIFKVIVKCSDGCRGSTITECRNVVCINVEKELIFEDFQNHGVLKHYPFIKNKHDFNMAKIIGYENFVKEIVSSTLNSIIVNNDTIDFLIKEYDDEKLYNKIKKIEILKKEHISRDVLINILFNE